MIGVGLVGPAVAERLLAAGYRITGYGLRPEQSVAFSILADRATSGDLALLQPERMQSEDVFDLAHGQPLLR